jgi:hypothetical protein
VLLCRLIHLDHWHQKQKEESAHCIIWLTNLFNKVTFNFKILLLFTVTAQCFFVDLFIRIIDTKSRKRRAPIALQHKIPWDDVVCNLLLAAALTISYWIWSQWKILQKISYCHLVFGTWCSVDAWCNETNISLKNLA